MDARPPLAGLTDTDARIVIEWTADDADIDLWFGSEDEARPVGTLRAER